MGEELSKVKKAVPYQCVIIGKSGAGKSTLLNWLNGTAYEEKRTASGNRYLEVLPGSEPGIVQTGHATKSETVLPNVLAVGSNMMVDCPGFFDTREGIVNIGNALNIKQIVTGNVKVLVVVNVNNLYGDRGHFQELLKLLDIFGQEFLKTGSYLIVLNKGNEYTYDECISRIKEIISGQEAYAPIREFMGHIINRIRKVNLLTTKQNDGLGVEELDIDVDGLKRHEFGLSERTPMTTKLKTTTIDGESARQQVQVKEPSRYVLNAELSHMPRYSGPINVALDPKDQKQVDQMTQGLIRNVKTELLDRNINHEVILLNYGMLVRLQGLLDNTMRIVDDQISQSFISIQRQISGLVKDGHFSKATLILSCLEQLRRALQRDEIGRVFIDKVNVVKYYNESREELDKAQAAQNEIEDRKKEVARLKKQQEAEQRERARLEADIKALQQKGSLSEGEVKTLKEKVDQLQKKLIDMVPSGGVVTKDEHARTQALLEETQLQLQRLRDEQKQLETAKDLPKQITAKTTSLNGISLANANVKETFTALIPLGNLHSKSPREIQLTLADLKKTSDNIMRRPGRKQVPLDLSQEPFDACHFNSSFMDDDYLCPAQIHMMQYIDPNFYQRLPVNFFELSEDHFDGDKWYHQIKNDTCKNARNTLEFLGNYFNKSSLIKEQLSKWSILILDHKVEISFWISEQSTEGARFLERIFKNARFVDIRYLEQSFGTVVDKKPKSEPLDYETVKKRLENLREADEYGLPKKTISDKPKTSFSNLVLLAAALGDVDAIEDLAKNGEHISTPNKDGITPLLAASAKGHLNAIKALVRLGADVNTPNQYGCTPVYIAAKMGHADVIRELARLGADINTPAKNGYTPVYIAAKMGHADAIRLLAELGADVNTPNQYGCTPVYIAAKMGHADAIRLLAELGADVNTPNQYGCTPVYIAAQEGHTDIIRVLKELGADVNIPTNDGYTPVLAAAHQGHTDTIRVLEELRARSTEDLATKTNSLEVDEYGLPIGDISTSNYSSYSPASTYQSSQKEEVSYLEKRLASLSRY